MRKAKESCIFCAAVLVIAYAIFLAVGPNELRDDDFYAPEKQYVSTHKCVLDDTIGGNAEWSADDKKVEIRPAFQEWKCDGLSSDILIQLRGK